MNDNLTPSHPTLYEITPFRSNSNNLQITGILQTCFAPSPPPSNRSGRRAPEHKCYMYKYSFINRKQYIYIV